MVKNKLEETEQPLGLDSLPDYLDALTIESSLEAAHRLDPLRTIPPKPVSGHEPVCDLLRWELHLVHGVNLLLYGPGTKFAALNRLAEHFAQRRLSTVVCEGFQPSFSLGKLIFEVARLLSPRRYVCAELWAATLHFIAQQPQQVYVFLHNIDGPALQSPAAQDFLARLAQLPNVRLAATLDNPYTFFLWTPETRQRLRFAYLAVASYGNWQVEGAFQQKLPLFGANLLLARMHGVEHLLRSFTQRQRSVTQLVALEQAAKPTGVTFRRLYEACVADGVVSNRKQLKESLAEGLSHKLFSLKKRQSHARHLVMNVDPETVLSVLRRCP